MNENEFLWKKVTFTAYYNDGRIADIKVFSKIGEVTDYNDEYLSVNGIVRVAIVECDDMITYSVPPDAIKLYEERI